MSRLIDADALKEFIGKVRAEYDLFTDEERPRYEAHSWALVLLNIYLDAVPTIDLVRCKECQELCKECAAEGVAERKRGEWIPCSERLPWLGVNVLIYKRNGDMDIDCTTRDGTGEARFTRSIVFNEDILAWMPLPPCYQEENNE